MTTRKARVFVSSDFGNDKALKEFLSSQTRHPDSPFEVSDYSLKEAAPEGLAGKGAPCNCAVLPGDRYGWPEDLQGIGSTQGGRDCTGA